MGFLTPWSHRQHCVWKSTGPAAFSYTPVFLTVAVGSSSLRGPGCWSGLGPLEAWLEPTFSPPKGFPSVLAA